MSEGRNVTVIIPAYNEEASLPHVLEALPKERLLEIIVVDNNSTDATAQVAVERGARVVVEKQKGYGSACLAGIAAIQEDTDIVVFLDGDFSDDPRDMNLLMEKIDEGYDLVIGSRLLGRAEKGALLPQARFGNQLATCLIKFFFGHVYTDLGPFRAIRQRALFDLNMKDRAFGWTVEMQVKAVLAQLKITEVSVAYKQRIGVSKITGTVKGTLMAGFTILWVIFTTGFNHVLRRKSR